MDYFKNYTPQDLLDIQEMSKTEINEFVHNHHYAKCSVCGKEIMYDDSPVLTDEKWQDVLNYYNIENNNDVNHVVKAYTVGSDSAKLARVNSVLKTYDDSIIICKECMEVALGHPLTKDILKSCRMNIDIIKKFNIK